MIIRFYSKTHATIKDQSEKTNESHGKSETNDSSGGILVSEQKQRSGRNEWSGDEPNEGQNVNEERKKPNEKQEVWLYQRAQASGHYPLTSGFKKEVDSSSFNLVWLIMKCATHHRHSRLCQ